MYVAEILEAKLYNRNWVDEAKQIIADDREDVMQRVTMDDAKEILQQFEAEFGYPQHVEEDNTGFGIWDYQWEQHHEVDGKWQRWFIKVAWYVPSKTGIVKVTRHRKYTDVKEATYHGLAGMIECPHCKGKGWEWYTTQYGEEDFDHSKEPCFTCDGEGEITKQEYVKRGFQVNEASHITDDFNSKLRHLINNTPSKQLYADSFIVNMEYQQTIDAITQALGEPDWESLEYGGDVPYWYLDNDRMVILLDAIADRAGNVTRTEVTAEYDPDGIRD